MDLRKLISQRGLVTQSPSAEEILKRAAAQIEPMRLFYGETYDAAGNPVDSLKYYFFVSELGRSLQQAGHKTDSAILIADTAACRNAPADQEARVMHLGQTRADLVQRVNEVFGTGLRIVRMSQYVNDPAFQSKRAEIMGVCRGDGKLMEMIRATVPPSKVGSGGEADLMYSFDEVATIIDLDLKVGPPREDLYDSVAREIAGRRGSKPLMSLFLTPTFPLGKNWGYFFANDSDDHGITAYKAGSKRLQDHRILLGRTTPEYARELIDASFVSANPALPNPVLDLAVIGEMARKRLEKDDTPITLAEEFAEGRLGIPELRNIAYDLLTKFILPNF